MTDHVTQAAEQAVMVCPQCAGEGGFPNGPDDAACRTPCTRCGGASLIVDLARLSAELAARSGEAGCDLDCREQSDGVRRWYSSAADDWFVCAKHNGHSPRNQQHGGSVA